MADKLSQKKIEEEIINTCLVEKTNWEQGVVYVTNKASYKMKQTIQDARRNYVGLYDKKLDQLDSSNVSCRPSR